MSVRYDRMDYKRQLPRASTWPMFLIVGLWAFGAAQVGREDANAAAIVEHHAAAAQERMIVPVRRCPEQFVAGQSDFKPWEISCVTIAQQGEQ